MEKAGENNAFSDSLTSKKRCHLRTGNDKRKEGLFRAILGHVFHNENMPFSSDKSSFLQSVKV